MKTLKDTLKLCILFSLPVFIMLLGLACIEPSSDSEQRIQQEKILKEATAQTGMPAIKNFRERKLLKDIIELRDQDGLVTFTYAENAMPVIIKGRTVMGGKFTYVGESIGYGIPASTQYTNPEKYEVNGATLPQTDPNGLFSPSSAEGTWVLLKNPNGTEVKPVYCEPRLLVSPFKFPFD